LINDVLDLAPEAKVKIAFINKQYQDTLSMELLWFSVPGRSLATAAKPPNLGLFMYAFEVVNLQAMLANL